MTEQGEHYESSFFSDQKPFLNWLCSLLIYSQPQLCRKRATIYTYSIILHIDFSASVFYIAPENKICERGSFSLFSPLPVYTLSNCY